MLATDTHGCYTEICRSESACRFNELACRFNELGEARGRLRILDSELRAGAGLAAAFGR